VIRGLFRLGSECWVWGVGAPRNLRAGSVVRVRQYPNTEHRFPSSSPIRAHPCNPWSRLFSEADEEDPPRMSRIPRIRGPKPGPTRALPPFFPHRCESVQAVDGKIGVGGWGPGRGRGVGFWVSGVGGPWDLRAGSVGSVSPWSNPTFRVFRVIRGLFRLGSECWVWGVGAPRNLRAGSVVRVRQHPNTEHPTPNMAFHPLLPSVPIRAIRGQDSSPKQTKRIHHGCHGYHG